MRPGAGDAPTNPRDDGQDRRQLSCPFAGRPVPPVGSATRRPLINGGQPPPPPTQPSPISGVPIVVRICEFGSASERSLDSDRVPSGRPSESFVGRKAHLVARQRSRAMLDHPAMESAPLPNLSTLDRADLSPWFNPFLHQFAQDAHRCGGEVRVVVANGQVSALTVSDPVERVGTVFTRSRRTAEFFVEARGLTGMYADFSFDPSAEVFDIFVANALDGLPSYRFRHSIRPYSAEDLPAALDLMTEVHGAVNERWFEGLPSRTEVGYLAEVNGRVAGIAWVSSSGSNARLHSLTVRAPYRRLHLGTDLLFARLLWAEHTGARQVLSEIARANVASQAIAGQAGMRRAGQIFFHRPRGGAAR